MNLANRAQEILLKLLDEKVIIHDAEGIASAAWELADAMQAEADKRALQKRAELRELLNHPNTFVEKEGMHFDDVEWQPDWSQAPSEANVITVDSYGVGQYWQMHNDAEPKQGTGSWHDEYCGRYLGGFEPDGFHGDWRNSLRKRPEVEAERNG